MGVHKKFTEEQLRERKKERARKYYLKHKERILENIKQQRKENPEKYREAGRKYRDNNREKCRAASLKWRTNNPERKKEQGRRSWRNNYYNPEKFINTLMNNIKYRSRSKKEVSIEATDLETLVIESKGVCAISGLPLTLERKHPLTLSVDRIDSSKGYIKGNIQLVAKCINIAKSDLKQEEFIAMCKAVVAFNS